MPLGMPGQFIQCLFQKVQPAVGKLRTASGFVFLIPQELILDATLGLG